MDAGWSWIDGVGALLIAALAIRGFLHGLWWQIVRLLGIAAAVAITRAISPRASPAVHEWFSSASLRAVNGWVWCVSLVIALFVVAMVARPTAKVEEGAEIGFASRSLGAVLGGVSALLLYAAALVCVCQVAAPDWAARVVGGSQSRDLITGLERALPTFLDVHAADAVHSLDSR